MLQLIDVSYTVQLGNKDILQHINVNIPKGQWVSIIGKNGSGKSTLIRLLNGLLPHSSGTIIVDGITLQQQTLWDIRERIGMVFSNPDNQFVGTTVTEDIVFGLENLCLSRNEMRERLYACAEQLQIVHLLERHPGQLSGGQKQRVAIASIIACRPKLIVFDEATSMLDEKGKHEVLELMHALKESGEFTLISVTHDHAEILASDRVISLGDGTIIADGKPHEMLKQEHILDACRLRLPYTIALCRKLKAHGIDIGEHFDEQEVMAALWTYNSSK